MSNRASNKIPNWYEILGISETITVKELEDLRNKATRKHHPDKYKSEKQAVQAHHDAELKACLDGVAFLLSKKGKPLLDAQLRRERVQAVIDKNKEEAERRGDAADLRTRFGVGNKSTGPATSSAPNTTPSPSKQPPPKSSPIPPKPPPKTQPSAYGAPNVPPSFVAQPSATASPPSSPKRTSTSPEPPTYRSAGGQQTGGEPQPAIPTRPPGSASGQKHRRQGQPELVYRIRRRILGVVLCCIAAPTIPLLIVHSIHNAELAAQRRHAVTRRRAERFISYIPQSFGPCQLHLAKLPPGADFSASCSGGLSYFDFTEDEPNSYFRDIPAEFQRLMNINQVPDSCSQTPSPYWIIRSTLMSGAVACSANSLVWCDEGWGIVGVIRGNSGGSLLDGWYSAVAVDIRESGRVGHIPQDLVYGESQDCSQAG